MNPPHTLHALVADRPAETRLRRVRRAGVWGALVALLVVAQTLLVMLTLNYEDARAQEDTDLVATEAAAEVRRELLGLLQALQTLAWVEGSPGQQRSAAEALLRTRSELKRVEWRAPSLAVTESANTPFAPRLFGTLPRQDLALDAEIACKAAQRSATPNFSRSYFVPLGDGIGLETVDLCVPLLRAGREAGFLVGSVALADILAGGVAALR